jgi:hypothetical protein
MGIRTIFRQPSCKPLSTPTLRCSKEKKKLQPVHGMRLPVFLLFTYNTTRSWSLDFVSTTLPNLFYSKRQIHQYMETGNIDAFDHAANCLVSIGSQLDLPFAYRTFNATSMPLTRSFQKILVFVSCGLERVIAQTNVVDLAVCLLRV